jgi:hypothetical protein
MKWVIPKFMEGFICADFFITHGSLSGKFALAGKAKEKNPPPAQMEEGSEYVSEGKIS